MIFEILEWGGRGMRFVKIEEWYAGFGFSTYQNVGLLIIRILSSVALLVCRVVMWNRKTMVYGRGVSCSGFSLLTFLLIYEV